MNSLNHETERVKPTRRRRGEISPETYREMLKRDFYRCVRCGAQNGELGYFKGVPFFKRLEGHHIEFRSQGGTGELRNAATVCGPPTQSGTCHHWAHTTREGREWFERWRDEFLDERGYRKDAAGPSEHAHAHIASECAALPHAGGRGEDRRRESAGKRMPAIRGGFGRDDESGEAGQVDIIDER